MKRFYYLSFVITLLLSINITQHLSAQSPVRLNLGIEGAIPVGDASDTYSAAAGVNLNLIIPLPVTNLDIIGSVGYQQWFFKSDVKDVLEGLGFDVRHPGLLPIRAGARYGFGLSPIYVKFDLGPAIVVKEATGGVDSGTAMSYSPGLGANLGPLEAELKYDIFSKSGSSQSFFGLKLAYYLF